LFGCTYFDPLKKAETNTPMACYRKFHDAITSILLFFYLLILDDTNNFKK